MTLGISLWKDAIRSTDGKSCPSLHLFTSLTLSVRPSLRNRPHRNLPHLPLLAHSLTSRFDLVLTFAPLWPFHHGADLLGRRLAPHPRNQHLWPILPSPCARPLLALPPYRRLAPIRIHRRASYDRCQPQQANPLRLVHLRDRWDESPALSGLQCQ